MPLYIDIHTFEEEISIDEVKKAHTADKAVQDQYGVKYLQFWVNKESGMVFCLAEGPNKETVEKVHQTAHGNIACNIVDVEPGFLKLFMGDGQPIDYGLVLNGEGTADPAYRYLMMVDVQPINQLAAYSEFPTVLAEARNLVLERIVRYKGRVVEKLKDDALVGVFDTSVSAVRCAKVVQQDLLNVMEAPNELVFRMGLCTGFPLTPDGEFFSEALQFAGRLCMAAKVREVMVDSQMSDICKLENISPLKAMTKAEEAFLAELFEEIDSHLSNPNFNIDHLSRTLGISRPQLYRKTLSLTGQSPKDFILVVRMHKALGLAKRKFGNVSEIALEVGYSSPSYFSKCFQKSFGCTPSKFMRSNAVPDG